MYFKGESIFFVAVFLLQGKLKIKLYIQTAGNAKRLVWYVNLDLELKLEARL